MRGMGSPQAGLVLPRGRQWRCHLLGGALIACDDIQHVATAIFIRLALGFFPEPQAAPFTPLAFWVAFLSTFVMVFGTLVKT
jgi:hypothetical protein